MPLEEMSDEKTKRNKPGERTKKRNEKYAGRSNLNGRRS